MTRTALLWCATSGVAPLLLESLASARDAGIDPAAMFVLLLDDDLAGVLERERVGVNRMTFSEDWRRLYGVTEFASYQEYGTDRFNKICFVRYRAMDFLFESGFDNVLHVDADIVLLANPLDDLVLDSPYASDAVLVQDDSGPGFWAQRPASLCLRKGERVIEDNICPGFALWRSLPEHRAIMRAIHATGEGAGWTHNDQDILSVVKTRYSGAFQILPASRYPNGAYFMHFRGETFRSAPLIFHANWVTGIEKKLKLIAEFRGMRWRHG